jgi:hypothetical protein
VARSSGVSKPAVKGDGEGAAENAGIVLIEALPAVEGL